jgi:hypothetical protein
MGDLILTVVTEIGLLFVVGSDVIIDYCENKVTHLAFTIEETE